MSLLYRTVSDHGRVGLCMHRGRCPVISVAAVVVDEYDRVLMRQVSRELRLLDTHPRSNDPSLRAAALREISAFLVSDAVWPLPTCEDVPVAVVASIVGAHPLNRAEYKFVYPFGASSKDLPHTAQGVREAHWMAVRHVHPDSLQERLKSALRVQSPFETHYNSHPG
ncbi:metal dependent phosphohydrolase [Streptomyces malaysiensis]|uniref:Metal dependent phosphohydrolase n=1 Tax=Streptomyces malaysiensis TaxID=92644 RepID=A0A7X5X7H8_STRMQ|nr:metal dependent phosphohydrolase [Streptomyces malaysiensis]